MSLIQLTDDSEINRAISLWKKIKEDHRNLSNVDITILNDAQKDDYLSNFIGVETITEEHRRLQESLKLYSGLEEHFAYFIAKKIAARLNLGQLKRQTYIEMGRALLEEKGQ